MPPPRIAVIGDRECSPAVAAAAESVGRGLAEAGAIVICGGLGGVMEAACRGAKDAGGLTIGILPGEDPTVANPFVDVPIATGLGTARNAIVVKSANAVIAIAGRFGTLSEIALALNHNIPVIGLDTWHLTGAEPMADPIRRAADPADAVHRALAASVDRPRPTGRE